MSKVGFIIEYAGLQLQVVKNANGEDVTPLKPISELFGVKWEAQRAKVADTPFYRSYFGVCTPTLWGADGQKREQTCILVSRVAAYLMTLNPTLVRAKGNETGADYLEAKLNEWADALHDYEELGVAVKAIRLTEANIELSRIRTFANLIRQKGKTAAPHDRKAIEAVQAIIARQIGIPYQPDMVDGQ